MSKFKKKLGKISDHHSSAVVVGDCFGHLTEVLEMFNSVFVIERNHTGIKAKNLIYRENFDNLISLSGISFIFFNLDTVNQLALVRDLWMKNNSVVIIEGNDPIDRLLSVPLYESYWRCTSLQKSFHVWEKMK